MDLEVQYLIEKVMFSSKDLVWNEIYRENQSIDRVDFYYNSPKGVWTFDIVQQSFPEAILKVFWSSNKLYLSGSPWSLDKKPLSAT